MIILIEETPVVAANGTISHVLDLQFNTMDEFDDLPNADKPFNSTNYSTGYNYGVPANGSIATCLGTSKTYVFSSMNGWIESGGEKLDYTVTIYLNGVKTLITSVKAGTVIQEPAHGAVEGKVWFGWWTTATMIGGTKISFPYTPTTDITLYGISSTLAGQIWEMQFPKSVATELGTFTLNYTAQHTNWGLEPNTMNGLSLGYTNMGSATAGIWLSGEADTLGFMSNTSYEVFDEETRETAQRLTTGTWANSYHEPFATDGTSKVTLAFAGGTDIANQTLVNWLTANATRTA